MKMYRIRKWDHTIKAFEVVKETEKTVTFMEPSFSIKGKFNQRRENKTSDYHEWFHTFEVARTAIVTRLKNSIIHHHNQMEACEEKLVEVEALRDDS